MLTAEELHDAALKLGGNMFKLWVLLNSGFSFDEVLQDRLMSDTTARNCLAKLVINGFEI